MGMIWYIAVGSALGGVSRYLIGGLVQRAAASAFPLGTLIVNVTGSFLLGLVIAYAVETPSLSPELRALLTIGFCGGYTTFSTFSFETTRMLQTGAWARAGLYVGLSVLLSLGAIATGFVAARQVILLRVR